MFTVTWTKDEYLAALDKAAQEYERGLMTCYDLAERITLIVLTYNHNKNKGRA